jgi:hypothetical protein
MRRFDYDDNNEENREDVDKFFGGEGEGGDRNYLTPDEYKAIMQEEMQLQQINLHLIARDLNDRLMFRIVRMLEKSFWWKFYSLNKKLRMIKNAYTELKRLSEGV